MNYFTHLKTRYEKELEGNVIPFWTAHGIDREYGGFFSYLERDGAIYDTRKPLWMQWRAVYMFAALYNSPFRREEYLDAAVNGFDFLLKHGRTANGSYGFMLDRRGKMLQEKAGGAELFSDSFAAIAAAELFIAAGDDRYEKESFRSLQSFLGNTAQNADAEWHLLAWPMIRLNVLDIMEKAFGKKIDGEMIRSCIEEVFTFRHPEKGIFPENRRADGSFDLDSQTGRFCNPGHALEGMSFILEILRKRKESDPELVNRYLSGTLSCVERIFHFGWDQEQGGIYYFRDILDKPLEQKECMLKAWWPQNEAATAMLRAFEASGDEKFLDLFEKIDGYSFLHLKDPQYPEWFAYAAVNGRQVHSYKASTWKGFFHLPRFLLNGIDICTRLEAK